MNDELKKANFNKLYVSLIIAILGEFFMNTPYTFAIPMSIAISILIITGEIIKIYIHKENLSHNIWKFQVFLILILLIPVLISLFAAASFPITALKSHTKIISGAVNAVSGKELPKSIIWKTTIWSVIPPIISLLGIVLAFFELRKE